jgi:DNA polymerase-3 subunit gamma/tau
MLTEMTSHQALYRRWRAQTFSQIVGQEAVVATLRNAVRANRVSHAILFVGPRGTGKTSLARILAKALNCTNLQDGDPCDQCESCVAIREGAALDVIEIDAASNRGINEVRELRDRLQYAPVNLRRKVYILDEAHQITRDAWNALLKSLEEPPEFVVFVFASTHPQDFPPAILSRLQRYDIRRLTVPEIEGKLARILQAENRAAEPEALRLIARLAAGGMRDAEAMLDQLLSAAQDPLDARAVRDLLGLAGPEVVESFISALTTGDAAQGIAVLDELEDRGRDLRTFFDQVLEGVRGGLVATFGQAAEAQRPRAGLLSVAGRLALVDPSRAGAAGLRLQLELALFGGDGSGSAPADPAARAAGAAAARATAASNGSAAPASGPPPEAAAGMPADAGRPESSIGKGTLSRVASERRPASAAVPPPGLTRRVQTPAVSIGPPEAPAAAQLGGDDSTAREATAPAREATAPAREATAQAGDVDELARLREVWPQIVAHLSSHPPTRPLIVACRPVAVEGNVVTLGFPEDQAFLKEVAVRRRPNLEAGIGQFLGRVVSVRCVATNLDAAPPGDDTDAAYLLAEARRIFADDLVEPGEIG